MIVSRALLFDSMLVLSGAGLFATCHVENVISRTVADARATQMQEMLEHWNCCNRFLVLQYMPTAHNDFKQRK